MREIKFRMWTGERYIYDENIVVDCLRQQTSGLYDHVNLHQSDFEQYTGLKDKNSKEIYEGDIVTAILIDDDLLCSGEIVYDEIMSFFGLLNDAGITPLFRLSRFEIVGNIHA